jgi:hypothetical protein
MKSSAVQLILLLAIVRLEAADPMFGPAPGSPFKAPGGGHNFVLGDANGDRKPDLLVCSGATLSVLWGNGQGGFERATNAAVELAHGASEMVMADFNRDGNIDWAGAHHDHYDVIVLLGNGDGKFVPASGSPFVARDSGKRPHTHGLAAGDLDGNGVLDLVTANNEDNDVSVLLGQGDGRFVGAPGSPFPVGRSPYPIALADVNGDGKLDLVAPNSGPANRTITVLLGDGKGALRPAPKSPFLAAGNAFFVAVADVNGDAKPDLIATHDEDSLATLLLGDGRGAFQAARTSPIELGNRAWAIVPIDLNDDGKLDLAGAGHDAVPVLIGDGRGAFRPAKASPFQAGKGSWRLALADLNGDDKLDIVTGNVESGNFSVLLRK